MVDRHVIQVARGTLTDLPDITTEDTVEGAYQLRTFSRKVHNIGEEIRGSCSQGTNLEELRQSIMGYKQSRLEKY
jgi:hypothetical protein